METTDALKQKLVSQYEEWKADFDKLKAETKGAYAEGQIEASEEAKELESNLEKAKDLISKVEKANEEDFNDLKAKAENQVEGFKNSFDKLKEKFK